MNTDFQLPESSRVSVGINWPPRWWRNFWLNQSRKAELACLKKIRELGGLTQDEAEALADQAHVEGYVEGSGKTQKMANSHLEQLVAAFAAVLDLNDLDSRKLLKVVRDHMKLAQKTNRDKVKDAQRLQKQVDNLLREAGIAADVAGGTEAILNLLAGINLNSADDFDLPS